MSKVKIAIDISPLSNGNSQRGVGYYTDCLIKALKKEIKENKKYSDWQIDLVSKPSRSNFNLIHYPFFDPFKLSLPSNPVLPFIVTVHDLIPREFKKQYPVGIRGEFKWLIQKNRLKQAKYIISVSHYSKYVISNFLKYPEDRIFVTYEGADDIFHPISDNNLLSSVKAKYNLPDKFILYVGDVNWNKNLPNLVKACLALDYPLVIAGSAATRKNVEDHPWNKDLIWLQKTHNKITKTNPNILTLTGYIPDEDLAVLYNLATIYCQPSYAEGFGLPLVQAMQSGCPIAYSKETSLPEVMDYNGLFFDPNSVKEIQNSLKSYWDNPLLRKKYSKLGLKRAEVFNWKYTAISTLAVYELALINEKQ